jgi:hypothetical protein
VVFLTLYDEKITNASFKTLEIILELVDFNICICGGWAVYFTVNEYFKKMKDRNYIGSQDIDIGFSLKPMMGKTELVSTDLFKMMKILEENGYKPSMFGYKKDISFEDNKSKKDDRTEENFTLYVDILVNSYPQSYQDISPQSFFEVPLIEKVYKNNQFQVKLPEISEYLIIPTREILGAMKIISIPSRGKHHKIVKDLCDLYSLIWFADESPDEIINDISSLLIPNSINRLKESINKDIMSECEEHLGESKGSINTVISQM